MVTATLCIHDAHGKILQRTTWPLTGSTSTFLYDDGGRAAQAGWKLGWLSWLPAHVASQYIKIITKIHCFHDGICKGAARYEPGERHVAGGFPRRLPKNVVRSGIGINAVKAVYVAEHELCMSPGSTLEYF